MAAANLAWFRKNGTKNLFFKPLFWRNPELEEEEETAAAKS